MLVGILTLVAVLLGSVALYQILKASEYKAQREGISHLDSIKDGSKTNAFLFVVFGVLYFAFFVWQWVKWSKHLLPESASEHGQGYDQLMAITMIIIIFVFFVTHIVLFWMTWKYVYNKDRKAEYISHNNKLELIWTVIPAIVLFIIITYGLAKWNEIMTPIPSDEDHITLEVYGRQFDWQVRYAGEDNKLGRAHFRLIDGSNPLGIDTNDIASNDDIVVTEEFHIPVNKPVEFVFRSQDVLHSAYMPHFRAQMNCVPGQRTSFHFKPVITTAEMKEKTNNKDFDYILLCNKICGASHYNMQMKIIVESEADYNKWLASKK